MRSHVMVGNCLLMALVVVCLTGCLSQIQNSSLGLEAGMETFKAATLSDDEVKSQAMQAREYLDTNNKVAAKSNKYTVRLNKMVNSLSKYDGIDLNYQVYMTEDINAFALADGSIRVYSGLMDMMSDDELLYIIGHEIGHVKLGHHKKSLQMAYAASAARKGAAASGGRVGAVAASSMGGFAEKLVNAQFSQSEEIDADTYGLEFLKAQNKKGDGAVSALEKLANLGGGDHSIFSSHPDPEKRAKRMASLL